MQIKVAADIRQAQALHRELGKGVKRAGARALNDTIRTVRAEGARAIKRAHPAMRIGDIKRAMRVERANQYRLRASVETTGTPLSLLLYGARQTTRGISARIGTARRGLVTYHGRKAFMVKKYNDVFVRRFGKGRQIRRFRGPSMPGVFRARISDFERIASGRWGVTFESRMAFEIHKAEQRAAARANAPVPSAITSFVERQFGLRPGSL